MDSTMSLRDSTALSRNWGWLMFKGIVGLIYGVWALFLTRTTLADLAVLTGVYLIIDGICDWVATTGQPSGQHTVSGSLVADGVVTIIAGIIAFFLTASPLGFVWVMAAWALISGILQISAATRLQGTGTSHGTVMFAGVWSVILAIALAVTSGSTVGAWAICLGIFGIVYGLDFIGVANQQHRGVVVGTETSPGYRSGVQPTVEDTRQRTLR